MASRCGTALGALTIAFSGVALVGSGSLVPGARHAIADTATDREVSRLFERSAVSYKAGRYLEAAELLRRCYQISPAPVLLLNLARALDKAGQVDEAIEAYLRYVQMLPDALQRAEIEKRVAELRAGRGPQAPS